MKTLVAYYRVSTDKQGKSGLGLEAQEAAANQLASQHDATILASYKEVETGKKKDRPELMKALAHAKRVKATLVVAKLDRLARNVAFLSALMESDVPFVVCDNPNANRLLLHILAAVAEDEARSISARTKAALAAYKARGGKLGAAREGHFDRFSEQRQEWRKRGAASSAKVRSARAQKVVEELAPIVIGLGAPGTPLQAIVDALNKDGYRTSSGKSFNLVSACRLVKAVLAKSD